MPGSATKKTTPPIVGAIVMALCGLVSPVASAGQFHVATCQADGLNFSTQAFDDFSTRGMKIRRACNPEGPGLRGLITANVIKPGNVPRGSLALVSITAPAGTRFTTLRWAGTVRRRDCRYALQLYADGPNVAPVSIKNVRANQGCPVAVRAQAAGYSARTFNIAGATRIVQRVICMGGRGRNSCSARASNFIRTYKAEVGIVDDSGPSIGVVPDTPLGRGEWVAGTQPLTYNASDNVGVRSAQALIAGQTGGSQQRSCALASPSGSFASGAPCPNGPGQITVDTKSVPEGVQPLVVQGQDAAGNVAASPALTARIDNTPPARVDVAVEGGDGWRNHNDFAVNWTNPSEPDRAPIVGARSKLCDVGGGAACSEEDHDSSDLSTLAMAVPGPGEWTLSLWRRDAAGNQSPDAASVPVTLRYDPEAPELVFEHPSTGDPTAVSVLVTDRVSGLGEGAIEISRVGSSTWQTLPTQKDGTRLIARIDDASLPAGDYLLRARASDLAQNEASTDRRVDGQPMALTLPLRTPSRIQGGVEHERVVRRTVRRHGKRKRIVQRVTVLKSTAHLAWREHVRIGGRLVDRDGQPIPQASIDVFSRTVNSADRRVAVVQTDADGRYHLTAVAAATSTLRLAYAGSPRLLPVQREVRLVVSASSSLTVSDQRVLNGQSVTFRGKVITLPVPRGGKLIELQVQLSGRWQTFRTTRTDSSGAWRVPYRFRRTRGMQRFRFRAKLPSESGYPFSDGRSHSLTVAVRGQA